MTTKVAQILYQTKFWEKLTKKEIVEFQLFEPKLCMPWNIFHEAVETVLDRPVYTVEFGFSGDELRKQFQELSKENNDCS